MRAMRKICALVLFYGLAYATPQDLKELVQNVAQNPLFLAKDSQAQALKKEKEALYNEYLPKVALGYAYQSTTNPDIFYPTRVDGGFLEAQWVVFDGLKREGEFDIADYKLKAKESEKQSTKEQIQLKIIQAYFNALGVESHLLALENQQKELQESIYKYQRFYDVGLASLDTLEAIKAQSFKNAYDMESTKTALKAYLEELSLLSGIEVSTLNARAKLQEVSTTTPQKIRQDLQANFYLTKAMESVESQYTYLPTITLSNRYTRYNYSGFNVPTLPFPFTIDMPDYQNIFGITIRFTLFDSFATLKAQESARLNALASNFEYAYLKDSQNRELIIAKEALKSAKEKISWADSGVKSASIAYSYAKEKFNAQLIDYTQYLNTLSALLNAQSFYDSARFDYEIKKAEFLYKNGDNLADFIKD